MNVFLFVALAATGSTVVLAIALRRARRDLERTRLRMERLDAIAEDVATREFELQAAKTNDSPVTGTAFESAEEDVLPEPRERAETPRPRAETPPRVAAVRDSGEFTPVGLQFNTEDVIDEEEFAAPRLMRGDTSEEKVRQRPGRKRHETPVGSPRNMTPRAPQSLLEVGSIQVRSEDVAPHK